MTDRSSNRRLAVRPTRDRRDSFGPDAVAVSVVIVNFRGAADTVTCVKGLAELDWPQDQLEVIVVDNDSGDGSAEVLRRELPGAAIIESGANLGFAGGCNLGVRAARGRYIALINNDARPHRDWVRSAVTVLDSDPTIGAVASKVLDWEGSLVDYVDGSLTWFGMGYKREAEQPDSASYDVAKDVLFGTGAAMFVRRELFNDVGGFDERFFMFYEDVDLGWRLNLLGHRVRYVPSSVAYHKHHATMNKFGSFREAYLLERNALLALYKNFEDATLSRVLPAAMALSVRRSLARTGTDPTLLDLQRSPGGDAEPDVTVSKMSLTGPYAIDAFVDHLPGLAQDRQRLQAARRRTDRDLMPLFRQAMEPAYAEPRYLEAHRALIEAFGVESHFTSRHRILVVTGDVLGERMAGPAIRAWEVAKALSREHDVELVSLTQSTITHPDFRSRRADPVSMRKLAEWSDVIVFQGFLLATYPWLADLDKVIVADIYDPLHLEVLEQLREAEPAHRERTSREVTAILNQQLARGDFFLCASDKQRDFWLGQLAGLGRLNPGTYDEDETLVSLIACVPFGISEQPPIRTGPGIRGVVDGIGPEDKVILWGGGIYNWFDPVTLIRAVDRLRHRHNDVKLFFMGLTHPNPGVPEMRVALEAVQLSDELGLTNRHVFFNEGWVSYEERQNYLLDANVGVSHHLQHIETEFSFRTRILDYLWASLPVIATGGDTFGDLIDRHELGVTVDAEDVEDVEQALERVLYLPGEEERFRKNVSVVAPRFAWSVVLEPLLTFCRAPRRAPDLVEPSGSRPVPFHPATSRRPSVRQDLALGRQYFRSGGPRELTTRALGRVRRLVRERRAAR